MMIADRWRFLTDFFKQRWERVWALFSDLSPRQRFLWVTAAGAVLLLGIHFGIIRPIADKLTSFNQKIILAEKNVIQNIRMLGGKTNTQAIYLRLLDNLELSGQSDEEARASMLKEIDAFARSNNISLTEVKPQVSADHQGYTTYNVRLQAESTMEQLLFFFRELARTKKLYLVESLRVVPHPEDVNKIKATVSISRAVFQSSAPPKKKK